MDVEHKSILSFYALNDENPVLAWVILLKCD